MRTIPTLLAAGMLVAGGCGGDSGPADDPAPRQGAATQAEPDAAQTEKPARDGTPKPAGTTVKVAPSEFGPMLYDSKGQAIYIFENDPKGKSVCYGECAAAWPPVLTDGEPRAGRGAKESLLGTVKRRDGKRQVTYAGKPLYFYAHEAPGEVRCHNVNLNGGYWWVVGPDGRRRA